MPFKLNTDDATRLIIQFLRENNLQHTLSKLQNESPITFNTVENKQAFIQDIIQGRWFTVLKQVNNLKLPIQKEIELYELALVELMEQGEEQAAAMLLNSHTLQSLRETDPDRYSLLDDLTEQKLTVTIAISTIYGVNNTKEKYKEKIANDISQEIVNAPASRLLTLLSQSLLWQQQHGGVSTDSGFDLFRGTTPIQTMEDSCVSTPYVSIKFPGKKTYAECAVFAPHGQFLATGTVDGFIEIWNYHTGKLRKDFKYQADDHLMAMDKAVLCLNFNNDGDLLASGSIDGSISVWKVQSGKCIRKLPVAHSQGVCAICFNKDGTQVLSGSYDHTIRLHGLKSGKALKEFRGHSSFVNDVIFSSDNTKILSTSSDGTVKIWDTKTTTCLYTIIPQPPNANEKSILNPVGGHGSQSIQQIIPLPKTVDQFLVCNKSNVLYIMNIRGQILKTLTHKDGKGQANDFIAAAISPKGDYIYGVGENSVLYCFQTNNGTMIHETKVSLTEITGLAGHPLANVLVVYDDAGYVYFLRP